MLQNRGHREQHHSREQLRLAYEHIAKIEERAVDDSENMDETESAVIKAEIQHLKVDQ